MLAMVEDCGRKINLVRGFWTVMNFVFWCKGCTPRVFYELLIVLEGIYVMCLYHSSTTRIIEVRTRLVVS